MAKFLGILGMEGVIEIIVKTIEKNAPKLVVKKVPIVSFGAGLVFGIVRAFGGDYYGALAEVTSGFLATMPGIGTTASTGVDIGLIAKDCLIALAK